MASVRAFIAGAAIFLLTACNGGKSTPPPAPPVKVSFEEISSQLREMGYEHTSANSTLWHHSSSLPREEAPRLHIHEGPGGWEIGLIDFGVFYCRPTMLLNLLLSPREVVERSKELFAQVPPKDRVAVPQNPDRGEIKENGLLCHVGRGG